MPGDAQQMRDSRTVERPKKRPVVESFLSCCREPPARNSFIRNLDEFHQLIPGISSCVFVSTGSSGNNAPPTNFTPPRTALLPSFDHLFGNTKRRSTRSSCMGIQVFPLLFSQSFYSTPLFIDNLPCSSATSTTKHSDLIITQILGEHSRSVKKQHVSRVNLSSKHIN